MSSAIPCGPLCSAYLHKCRSVKVYYRVAGATKAANFVRTGCPTDPCGEMDIYSCRFSPLVRKYMVHQSGEPWGNSGPLQFLRPPVTGGHGHEDQAGECRFVYVTSSNPSEDEVIIAMNRAAEALMMNGCRPRYYAGDDGE